MEQNKLDESLCTNKSEWHKVGLTTEDDLRSQKSIKIISRSLEKQQYWIDKSLNKMENKKQSYLIVFITQILISFVSHAFLIGLNVKFISIKFQVSVSFLTLVSSGIIIIFEIISLFIFRKTLVNRRSYIQIYITIVLNALQQIVNIINLFAIIHFSICGTLIWNLNECFEDLMQSNNIINDCEIFDSNTIHQKVYDEIQECLNRNSISKNEFNNDLFISSNMNFIFILSSVIIYKLTFHIIINLFLIVKTLKLNRGMHRKSQHINFLSSCYSNTTLDDD